MADYSYVAGALQKRGFSVDPEIADNPDIVAYKEFKTGSDSPDIVTLLVHFYEENSEFAFEVVASPYYTGTDLGFSKDVFSTGLSANPTDVPNKAVELWLDASEDATKRYISALKMIRGV